MRISVLLVIVLLLASCSTKNKRLPILGPKQFANVNFAGGINADTIYHTIRDFSFVDQDSNTVTNESFRDKIYVADFFFTSCPTICPIMKTQMLRVYQKYMDNPDVKFLSHSIDPEFDTVAVLHDFAERLGVKTDVWHFVTGIKDSIYSIGQESYMVTATSDPNEPGGYLHSGAFLLIDKQRRIRGIYDGTKPEKVDLLMNDIAILLEEYKQ